MTPRHPRKTLHPKPRPRKGRLRVAPMLTPEEVKRLHDSAKADFRSIGGYVAWLVERDLQKRGQSNHADRWVSRPPGVL